MQLWKYRIFNKYYVFSFFVVLISLFGIWMADSEIMKFLPFTYDYELMMETEGITYEHAEESRVLILNEVILSFDNYMSIATNINSFLMILAPMTGMIFFAEKNGLFQYKFTRGKGYLKTVLGSMMINALIIACWMYLAIFIYTTVGIKINNPTSTISRSGFEFIMPGFFDKHMYLYYLLNGFVVYFLYTFTYCLFSCAVSFYTNKKYLAVIIPMVYTLGLSVTVGFIGSGQYIPILDFISPISTLSFGAYMTGGDELLRALCALVPPLLFVAATLIYKMRGSEKI